MSETPTDVYDLFQPVENNIGFSSKSRNLQPEAKAQLAVWPLDKNGQIRLNP